MGVAYVLNTMTWKSKVEEAYSDAAKELKAVARDTPELAASAKQRMEKFPQTQDVLMGFAGYANAPNHDFVDQLTAVMKMPRDTIPAVVQNMVLGVIEHRERIFPTTSEPAQEMQTALSGLYANAKSALTLGDDEARRTAAKKGDNYATLFSQRLQSAQRHVAHATIELSASPERAVQWCADLASYSSQELHDVLPESHVAMSKIASRDDRLWNGAPPAVRAAAMNVVTMTEQYAAEGMPFIMRGNGGNGDKTMPITINPRTEVLRSATAFTSVTASSNGGSGSRVAAIPSP